MTYTLDDLICHLREHRKITPGSTPVRLGGNGQNYPLTSVSMGIVPDDVPTGSIPVAGTKELVLS